MADEFKKLAYDGDHTLFVRPMVNGCFEIAIEIDGDNGQSAARVVCQVDGSDAPGVISGIVGAMSESWAEGVWIAGFHDAE